MKRSSLKPLWYIVIVCLLVSFGGGSFAQANKTVVPAKEKSTQQKPRLQVDTVKPKPDVKPAPGVQKDKMPMPQQKGKTVEQKNAEKTQKEGQPAGEKESPEKKESADVKGTTQETPGNKQYEHSVGKNEPQGNAYGKDKGGLQGKEFGQQRAEQARLNREVKGKELDEKIVQGEAKVKEAREKIERAKAQLEKDKTEGRITEEVYQERKEKISKAEQALSNLEVSIDMGKKVTVK